MTNPEIEAVEADCVDLIENFGEGMSHADARALFALIKERVEKFLERSRARERAEALMKEQFDFGGALARLKEGKRVERGGWNGKNMWIRLQSSATRLVVGGGEERCGPYIGDEDGRRHVRPVASFADGRPRRGLDGGRLMLFDVHLDLVKRLAREAHVGKRDVEMKTVKLGPNEVTLVSAKSEDGVEFLHDLRSRVPVIKVSAYAKRSQVEALQPNPVVIVEEGPDDEEDEDLDEDDLDDEDLDEDDLDEDLDEEDQDLEEDE